MMDGDLISGFNCDGFLLVRVKALGARLGI
jgi:hypothetical protein